VLLLVLEDLWVGLRYIALAIFVLASLTDWVDGKIARKKNIVTRFGKLMDPLADKILVASGFIMLTGLGVVPAWVTVLVVCRDFLLNTIRMFGTEAGVTISAGIYGKIKTAFQMLTVTLGLIDTNGLFKFMSTQGRLMGFGELLLNVGFSISLVGAVIFTVWSTIDYVRKCGKYIDIRQ
jgi:CDP-diacylglycerol--glycerol-3-phosphate 3-phosphatidyltransferase